MGYPFDSAFGLAQGRLDSWWSILSKRSLDGAPDRCAGFAQAEMGRRFVLPHPSAKSRTDGAPGLS